MTEQTSFLSIGRLPNGDIILLHPAIQPYIVSASDDGDIRITPLQLEQENPDKLLQYKADDETFKQCATRAARVNRLAQKCLHGDHIYAIGGDWCKNCGATRFD